MRSQNCRFAELRPANTRLWLWNSVGSVRDDSIVHAIAQKNQINCLQSPLEPQLACATVRMAKSLPVMGLGA